MTGWVIGAIKLIMISVTLPVVLLCIAIAFARYANDIDLAALIGFCLGILTTILHDMLTSKKGDL